MITLHKGQQEPSESELEPRLAPADVELPHEFSTAEPSDGPAPRAGAIRASDEERLRQLHELYAPPLLRFLMRHTFGDRFAAEDLLQETMLRAWRSLSRLDLDSPKIRSWLFTVAHRVAIDAARVRSSRPSEVGGADLSGFPEQSDPLEALLDEQEVDAALATLDPDHRSVLEALYLRDKSGAEAAGELGIPEGTVKSRAHYALRPLRAGLGRAGAPRRIHPGPSLSPRSLELRLVVSRLTRAPGLGSTRPASPVVSVSIDLAVVLGSGPTYAGFSASSGMFVGEQDLLSWSFVQ
jgi:RNA polymerase sigma-70 factor (ECF subfamily)